MSNYDDQVMSSNKFWVAIAGLLAVTVLGLAYILARYEIVRAEDPMYACKTQCAQYGVASSTKTTCTCNVLRPADAPLPE